MKNKIKFKSILSVVIPPSTSATSYLRNNLYVVLVVISATHSYIDEEVLPFCHSIKKVDKVYCVTRDKTLMI